MTSETNRLKRRLEREKTARLEAEKLLEEKSAELYDKNLELYSLSESLEKLVAQRTSQMQKARDDALNALRIRSDFIANMSHELRTPLNGVLGVLTLLQEQNLTKGQQELLEVAEASGRHLLEVINDILDFSKIEANKVNVELSDIEVHSFFSEVTQGFKFQAQQKGLSFEILIDDDVAAVLKSDPLRIKQIISNLLSNAIKFTHEGAVILRFAKVDNANFKIVVSDTGIGISKQNLDLVFSAFEQADTSITRDFGGTGLGMNITKRLVDMLNGDIQVESSLGEGTTFIVSLPMQVVSNTHNSHVPILDKPKLQLDKEIVVLLVEDNKVNQMIAEKMLSSYGVTIHLAENGKEAISKLDKLSPNIVFMDLQMPIMGGIEASKRIRNKKLLPEHTPIVAMTAHSSQEHINECLNAGMQAHISKPIERHLLEDVLQKFAIQVSAEDVAVCDLPNIQDVDVAGAVNRVGGDFTLYLQLVQRFFIDSNFIVDLGAHRLQDKSSEAMHRIKGSGANLGMSKLASIAASLEIQALNNASLTEHECEQLVREYQRVHDEFAVHVNTLQKVDNVKISHVSSDFLKEQLLKVKQNIYQDVTLAETTLNELLKYELSSELTPIIETACDAMLTFNMQAVDDALQRAFKTLGQ